MPLIDDIGVVPYATKKMLSTVLSPAVGNLCEDTIEGIRTSLIATGWNQLQALRPFGRVVFPLGFPFTTGRGSGDCGCSSGWVIISTPTRIYRFSSFVLGQTPTGGPGQPGDCYQFPLGGDVFSSLTSLTLEISFWSPYTATLTLQPDGITYVIDLVAKVAGPHSNFDTIDADGRFGIGSGIVTGGGYQFESVGSSYYQVTVTGGVGIGSEQVIGFDVTLGPAGKIRTVSYPIGSRGIAGYNIVSNPYSLAVFDLSADPRHSIAIFAPCVVTAEGFTGAYAVTVIGPGNLTNLIMWEGFAFACTTCLDNYPATFGDNFDGPGVLCLRSMPGGLPLYTLDGRPLSTAAYLFMGAGSVGAGNVPSILGKLWDCIVITDAVAVGGTFQFGGRDFICIASQDGTGSRSRGSLLFCTADNGQPTAGAGISGGSTNTGGPGTGGGGSPTVPGAPAGSGNGSKTGTCTSTGVPDNETVVWTSGDKFDSSMIGQTITITIPWLAHPWVSSGGSGDATGTLPVVASITSPTVLKTTANLNSSFDSASFRCP